MAKKYMDLFVVEYSLSQGAFNVSTIKEMLEHNFRMIVKRQTSNDYLVVGIAASHEDASKVVDSFRKYLEKGEFPDEMLNEDSPVM
jgi:hypothetical protein